MDTIEAFSFLDLKTSASRQELEASFRRLVMRYHPDKNPGETAWSHTQMTLLNEAHEIAQRHIASRETPDGAPLRKAGVSREHAVLLRKTFQAALDSLLEGIHLYYIFNLENIHLRLEGSRRYRYNSSKRNVKKALGLFDGILRDAAGEEGLKTLSRLYKDFGQSFYESMGIAKISPAESTPTYKPYTHYRNASLIIDTFIRLWFFPNDFKKPHGFSSEHILLCEKELFLILTNYRDTIWTPEARIKLSLLDNLRSLIDFEERRAR
jgi:hypothetical protein